VRAAGVVLDHGPDLFGEGQGLLLDDHESTV
jgi:hypothetical protein